MGANSICASKTRVCPSPNTNCFAFHGIDDEIGLGRASVPRGELLAVKRKLILRNFLSPGDIVMLTAAVRDLHTCHPGRFITDVRTSCPELWEHNPHLTPLREDDPNVEIIDCHYPLIDRSNHAPYHCIHGFADFLSERLRVPVRPTLFRGDIHLSAEEQTWKSTVHELAGRDVPFWIVNAGGKFDFTIKWWDWRRYQQVIDYFRGRILFVQIGELGHYHPPLRHVVDLRGKTDLRQLVRLTYHAQGVLCGVTALMHLAAAVPTRPDRARARAAVIIAGGREPTHWEAYPHHQFLHTIGALPCCEAGGCWRSRTRALGDGESADAPDELCHNVIEDLPACMDLITADEVIRRLETFFRGGANAYLRPIEFAAARRAMARSIEGPRFESTVHLGNFREALTRAAADAQTAAVPVMNGRGVLLLARTMAEAERALNIAKRMRASGCELSAECWHASRWPKELRTRFNAASVTLCDAAVADDPPLSESELRFLALERTSFREVLVIDPGELATLRCESLFQHALYRSSGALFFDERENGARPGAWNLCGMKRPIRTAAANCFLIDRTRWWHVVQLWRWICERQYFFHGYLDGDGAAAQLAFAMFGHEPPLLEISRRQYSRRVLAH